MDNITYDDFRKLDLRVGRIESAEEVPGADKLYKLMVDIGSETRQMVAGIKPHYKTEELVGRKVVVLTNLEPRVIRGVESRGMVLAASSPDQKEIVITALERDIAPGSIVK